jgi:ceramide glucosyltransferase
MADPRVELVCNVIRGMGGRSMGAIMENLHLNSFIMGSMCFLERFLKMPCVVGKSMLLRRSGLDEIGGLHGVKDILAEDYMIGRRLSLAGGRIVLSSHMIDNVNQDWNIRRFLNRHTRWGKMRWKIGGVRYFSELLVNPVLLASLPLLIQGVNECTLTLAAGMSAVKMLGDAYLGRKIRAGIRVRHYLLTPLKDMIIGIIWFVPFLSHSVTWRGQRYRLGKDSLMSPASLAPPGHWGWFFDSRLLNRAARLRAALRT